MTLWWILALVCALGCLAWQRTRHGARIAVARSTAARKVTATDSSSTSDHSSIDRMIEYGIHLDDEGLQRTIGSIREQIRWSDVERIVIVTNGLGPWLEDVHWLFVGADGGCAVPGLAVDRRVFDQLKRFEGVDYGSIIEAMGSTGDATFHIWSRTTGLE